MKTKQTSKNPECVGFIMDGNRRWAEIHGLTQMEGHLRGYEAFRRMVDVVHKAEIPHMVCYAFSTENWRRTNSEVEYLMELLGRALHDLHASIMQDGKKLKLRVIGQRERLPKELVSEIERLEALPMEKPDMTLWLALSYGGRAEILEAIHKARTSTHEITEENFSELLWTKDMPDPDLIIRTSGEMRMSNFLLWQSAYSELFFTDTLWPDFGEVEFQSMLEAYGKRSRRTGA